MRVSQNMKLHLSHRQHVVMLLGEKNVTHNCHFCLEKLGNGHFSIQLNGVRIMCES